MKLLRIFVFVLRAQAQQTTQGKNFLSLIGNILFIALLVLYAIGAGMLFQYNERLHLTAEQILYGINSVIAGMTIIKSYFPSYKPILYPIPTFFPVSRLERASMGVLLDLFNPYLATILLFYGIVFSLSFSYLSFIQIVFSLVCFIAIVLADRSIKCLLEYQVRFRLLHGIISILCLVVLFLKPSLLIFYPLSLILAIGLITIQQGLLAYEMILPKTQATEEIVLRSLKTTNVLSKTAYTIKAFLGTKAVATLLVMGLLVQLFPLVFVAARTPEQAQRMITEFHFNIIWVFIAPIVCFTYILNNAFGLNWHLWQTIHLHNGSRKSAASAYTRLAIVILILEIVLLLPALWYRNILNFDNMIFWILSSITMLSTGFVLATIQAVKVEKISLNMMMSFRSIGSPISSITNLLLILLLVIACSFHYTLGFVIAAISVIVAFFITNSYKILKHKTYYAIHR